MGVNDSLLIRNEIKEFSWDNLIICNIKDKSIIVSGNIIDLIDEALINDKKELVLSWEETFDMLQDIDREKIYDNWNRIIEKKNPISLNLKVKVNINTIIFVSSKLKPFINEESGELECFCGYLHNVTRVKNLESNIRRLLEIDLVTKLPSKYFVKRIIDDYLLHCEKEMVRGALLLINLDNFKMINDSYSHDEGDLLLESVANKLTNILDDEDLICRYSADEYIIFKPNLINITQAEEFVIKVKKVFEAPFKINEEDLYITASIGVSIFPENGTNFKILLKNADTAMYRAKSNGKDEWEFFNVSISTELNRTYDIQRGLRTALEQNEMYVVFQPKVILADSIVNGFEALVRWNSSELGMVSPAEFIPIAESTRQIIPIGSFVLEEVFKKIKELLLSGYDNFKVAVNFSDIQLRYGSIVNEFLELMHKYDVPSRYIEVEITESVLMKTFNENLRRLESIKGLGVTVALDDFGTGYSSLSYLTKLPIDVLKIDRTFIMDLLNSNKCRTIVENIIKLSHELGIYVVAEGVEEIEQVNYLKEMLCDVVQGYYFSKPQEFEDIKCMLGKKLA